MKVLFLVQKEQRVILDRLYEAVGEYCNMDLRWLTSDEQSDLKKYFKEHVDVRCYERIILFLRFKKELKQIKFISSIPNLVILEHDAYQNYIDCKYQGKFSFYYSRLPWARIISSGARVVSRLQKEGFDAVFVPKGYDQALMSDLGMKRDIELGFVGSIKSATYSRRKEFLEQLALEENLLITRTSSGDEYVRTLNSIRFFVSADIGMEEYMIKNFEAMACGCVLFAYDQGDEENDALGFIDLENIVLYKNVDDFKVKLGMLRNDVDLVNKIIAGSKVLVKNYSYEKLGGKIVAALNSPLRVATKETFKDKIKKIWGGK